MTKLPRAGRVLAATAVLVAAVLPLALPGPARAAGQLECIGVVVDPLGSGSPRAADTFCATVPYGATGAQVLAARAKALNRPQPRYQGGLLCAIDGYPTTGCGDPDRTRGGYDYWSYWHRKRDGGAWTYSGTGADQYSPVPGDLEGWAFQQGGPEGGRVPPDVSAESVCATARPVSAPSKAARTTAAKPSRSAHATTAAPAPPPPSRTATSRPTPHRAQPAGSHPSTMPPTTPPTSPPTTPRAVATSPTAAPLVAAAKPDPATVAHTRSHPPVGAIVAGIAVLVLAAGAVARSRLGRR